MTSTLSGWRFKAEIEMLSDQEVGGGGGIRKCFGRQVFIFFVKENWICDMTRHHAEPNINIFDEKSSFGL